MICKSLWHLNPEVSSIKEHPLIASNDPTKKLIQTQYSMISTGTEKLIAQGKVASEFYDKMSVPYMEGNFDLPIKYGYACAGADEDDMLYHFMHPHQNFSLLDPTHLFSINGKLESYKIPLISNIETVLNAIWDGAVDQVDKIAICGFGNIGSLLANTLRVFKNKEVTIIEKNDWRAQKAASFGWTVDADATNSYDLIYHTTATTTGLQYCIDHLNEEGVVIELSWYGNQQVNLSLGKDFHYKRLTIKSSQVSNIPINKRDEFDFLKRKKLAAKILQDDSFDQLIADFIPFDQTPSFFGDLRKNNLPDGLIWLIQY